MHYATPLKFYERSPYCRRTLNAMNSDDTVTKIALESTVVFKAINVRGPNVVNSVGE
jgi:hypothetical protein